MQLLCRYFTYRDRDEQSIDTGRLVRVGIYVEWQYSCVSCYDATTKALLTTSQYK